MQSWETGLSKGSLPKQVRNTSLGSITLWLCRCCVSCKKYSPMRAIGHTVPSPLPVHKAGPGACLEHLVLVPTPFRLQKPRAPQTFPIWNMFCKPNYIYWLNRLVQKDPTTPPVLRKAHEVRVKDLCPPDAPLRWIVKHLILCSSWYGIHFWVYRHSSILSVPLRSSECPLYPTIYPVDIQ